MDTLQRVVISALFGLSSLGACEGGSGSYNQLDSLRILGLSGDPPTLPPAQADAPATTVLQALVYHPELATPTYAWSWCPLRGGIAQEYECAIDEPELRSVLASIGVESEGLSYGLGTGPTAIYESRLSPEALSSLCRTPLGPQGGDVSGIPDCRLGFPLSIGLTVRVGAEEVTAFKEIRLALNEDQAKNGNPTIAALSITLEGGAREESVPLLADGTGFEVSLGSSYELFADVPESAAETFVAPERLGGEASEQQEKLVMTWFVEAGDLAAGSTSYDGGLAGMEVLEHNTWNLPEALERSSDTLRIYVVLHDTRGGMQWLMRTVRVAPNEQQLFVSRTVDNASSRILSGRSESKDAQ